MRHSASEGNWTSGWVWSFISNETAKGVFGVVGLFLCGFGIITPIVVDFDNLSGGVFVGSVALFMFGFFLAVDGLTEGIDRDWFLRFFGVGVAYTGLLTMNVTPPWVEGNSVAVWFSSLGAGVAGLFFAYGGQTLRERSRPARMRERGIIVSE